MDVTFAKIILESYDVDASDRTQINRLFLQIYSNLAVLHRGGVLARYRKPFPREP